VLKKGENREDLTEYERNIFETTSEMEIWDIRRIEITLKLAVTYEHMEIFSRLRNFILSYGVVSLSTATMFTFIMSTLMFISP